MIYLLKLIENKYFILRSQDMIESLVLLKAEIEFDFLKKYTPISILSTLATNESDRDLDNFVKDYIRRIGIEYVRGGSYYQPILTEYQIKALEMENNNETDYQKEIEKIIEIANKPYTKKEIIDQLEKLESDYVKFQKEKSAFININIVELRKDIKWIISACEKQFVAYENFKKNTYLYQIENAADIEKYKKILVNLKNIINTTLELEITIDDVFLYNPEFVFDDFFYHWHRIHLPKSAENVYNICLKYERLLNKIENRKEERDFDIESWGKNAEWRMPREIYLLKKMLHKGLPDTCNVGRIVGHG